MRVDHVAIIGAGQMGSGIALVAAVHGAKVAVYDAEPEQLERGYVSITKQLERWKQKRNLTDIEQDNILSRIQLQHQLKLAVSGADLVIEAIVEKKQAKAELFQQLDHLTPMHAILATNTSSIPIGELAAHTTRPEQIIGMHFMNPVPVMKLIEVIRGLRTSEEVFQIIMDVARKWGKVPVAVNDFPGFVSNRILMPMINEAIFTVYEGVASPEDIDQVMTLGMNHPLGPLALADLIGLDTCLMIMETLHEGFADSKYRPCPLLRQYVQAGWLGRKSGRGFYKYG